MDNAKRASWASNSTFVLAAIGSAVGLGNAWRFPGLAAKHGGGAFLLVYAAALVIIGIPLLMMEISIGRKLRRGAPGCMRGLGRRLEPIGWAATGNAFVISVYYAVVFAWVILMAVYCFKFAGITGDTQAASSLWSTVIQSTGTTSGYTKIAWPVVGCLVIAWVLIYSCIRNGASSVGKVVKYTVFLPVVCLVIMAVKGFTMPGALEGLSALFYPDFSKLSDPTLWIDAIGQVFYSMSVMMAVLFAYGSFLRDDSNIAVDGFVIAFADLGISVLSGIVLFTTMYGTGMSVNDMSASGIGTAFMIYPAAIVSLTSSGTVNAIFAFIFYFCLCTLAIDSAFSIVEGVSTAIADNFKISSKKTTIGVCIAAGVLSLFFVTGAGQAWLDIVDNWCNNFNLILIGILETVAIGWCFGTIRITAEINRNARRFKMPAWWMHVTVKYLAPVLLTVFFCWNLFALFSSGGVYGAELGYGAMANIIGGWLVTVLVFASGLIVRIIEKRMEKKGFTKDTVEWTD